MEENIYKRARLAAAKTNSDLKTVEKAFPHLFISREKLLMIEQTDPKKKRTTPTPSEVEIMAQVYEAPELRDYYCTGQCPLGKHREPLKYNSLGDISASLMAALYFLDNASDRIHTILSDNRVTDEEKEDFLKSLSILKNIAYSANCLELWAKKNGFIEE